jgi:hypothetical protein
LPNPGEVAVIDLDLVMDLVGGQGWADCQHQKRGGG